MADERRINQMLPNIVSNAVKFSPEAGARLGLPITKSFADLHGGSLNIASILGAGTVVTIVFPPERVIGAGGPAANSAEIAA